MAQLHEKRTHMRHACEGRVTLLYTQRQSRQIEADLINYSKQGLGFFTRRPLAPGTTMILRASMENYPLAASAADCQLRTMGLVTIKWCQEESRQGEAIHCMGAVYVMSY